MRKPLLQIALTAAALAAPTAANAQASNYYIDRILEATRKPKTNLVLLAAHRGLWEDVPENTREAIDAARLAGIETIEIDVRLSKDGTPWLLHDYTLDRTTTGRGLVSMNSDATLSKVFVRNRDGTPSATKVVKLEEALKYLGDNLKWENGQLRGFVLVIDLKSPHKSDPNSSKVSGYEALKKSYAVVRDVSKNYPGLYPTQPTAAKLGHAIIFKLKGKELPAPAQLQSDLNITANTPFFRMEPVLHPDDATSGNTVINQYLDIWYNVGFETVQEYIDQPVVTAWMAKLKNLGRTTPGFPGWSDYSEGVATANGNCCLDRNTNPANTDKNLDYSASIEFQDQLGANWLTADTVLILDALYKARGKRDMSQLLSPSFGPEGM